MLKRIVQTQASKALILIRLVVGAVFLSEGIQKFLFAADLGAGRFAKIGIPLPDVLGPVVGGFEIVCGLLVLIGLLTRVAVIPLLAIMAVAIASTKFPMIGKSGIWKTLHEGRTDYAMLLCLIYLLITGAGSLSVDAKALNGDK